MDFALFSIFMIMLFHKYILHPRKSYLNTPLIYLQFKNDDLRILNGFGYIKKKLMINFEF